MHVSGDQSEFLKPTLVGVGIGTSTVALLTLFLLIIAMFIDLGGRTGGRTGGRADGDGGNGTSQAAGNETGTDPSTAAGGDAASQPDDSTSRPPDRPATETSETQSVQPSGSAAPVTTRPVPTRKPPGFSIAALPDVPRTGQSEPAVGDGQGASGGGFSDVGERLSQAGAKSGGVQISLAWNNRNDLDLHVIAPSGERIFFSHKRSGCNGELDIDMNAGGSRSNKPVENVYWPAGRAPRGRYRVQVHHYANYGDRDPTRYQVRVMVDGAEQNFSGSLSFDGRQPVDVHQFTR